MKERFFIRKKEGFRDAERALKNTLLALPGVRFHQLSHYSVYDAFELKSAEREVLAHKVLADHLVDEIVDGETIRHLLRSLPYLAVQYREGQFDPRASAAEATLRLLLPQSRVSIRSAHLYFFEGLEDPAMLEAIRHYLINPVDACEKDFADFTLRQEGEARPLKNYSRLLSLAPEDLEAFIQKEGLAMSAADLALVQSYFRDEEKRAPSEVELRVLDTYWSDHCRHTTFNTRLPEIHVGNSPYAATYRQLLDRWQTLRQANGRGAKAPTLMDLATIAARDRLRRGRSAAQEVSAEINACSIHTTVHRNDGREIPYLLQFKNETHNHPTEIEPFGGAATCLGGAIRDPLSGRAYVYQALRLSGAGNINTPLAETLPHKLPQQRISTEACRGYSSYGNQIGLATTKVREFVHPGYVAKRLELGAVVAAVPEANVQRAEPRPGDCVVLVGGATGRDGIGGATGSSKSHNQSSLQTSGAEVQKGNPLTERALLRLFRNPEAARLIRRCNDFGAGGVAVAVGELAPSLDIDLDQVPVKYQGLNAMELAISESQERMAVLLDAGDAEHFIQLAAAENLSAVVLAKVTAGGRLRMFCSGEKVLDIARSFLDTNGAARQQKVEIDDGGEAAPAPWHKLSAAELDKESILAQLRTANSGSQEGMTEQFDSSIGRSTVLMPLGGFYEKTEEAVSAQTLPAAGGTSTASVMAYGFSPRLADLSPYLTGAYSVVEAMSRLVAAGVDPQDVWLSCQEFFPHLGDDPHKWGRVVAALLGLLEAQEALDVAAIGGKDSMSGTYETMEVPGTIVSFAIAATEASSVISATLPAAPCTLCYLPHPALPDGRPNYPVLRRHFADFHRFAGSGKVLAAMPILAGGLLESVSKMALGNRCGLCLHLDEAGELAASPLGGLIYAVAPGSVPPEDLPADSLQIGHYAAQLPGIAYTDDASCMLSFASIEEALESAYRPVYPLLPSRDGGTLPAFARPATSEREKTAEGSKESEGNVSSSQLSPEDSALLGALPTDRGKLAELCAQVQVLIPLFPGTNCEYDTSDAFTDAGARVRQLPIRNLTAALSRQDEASFLRELEKSQILALVGGFSMGDEPDGTAKYIAAFLSSPAVCAGIQAFLARKGLIIGICNGFQALVKAGWLPYGDPARQRDDSPVLFNNRQGRHISRIVRTRVSSRHSPWLADTRVGQIYMTPVSHGEGRLLLNLEEARQLFATDQVAFQYVDEAGQPTLVHPWNPNGSLCAIEGLLSADGHILGRMGHAERYRPGLMKNIPGDKEQPVFASGVRYAAAVLQAASRK